ncbi:MAG TPA: metallophosphoesterase [Polyangiaceae bacterium]|nr:metallophosphoesterase [Polyangiaceae bacterium]
MPRLIVIGDVHGCSRELDALLDRLGIMRDDRVVFVGDLVAKGPNTHLVLETVRRIGAEVTLGNHEKRLLDARDARREGRPLPRLDPTHARLLDELTDEDWAQLEAMPLWLDVDPLMRVVHAGIVPGVPMRDQDPHHLITLRSISATGEPSSKWGPPWAARYQGPPHIVFGHNARKDPQLHPDATGLDTGCVYGGALTALVVPLGSAPPELELRRDALVAEPARKAYADYGGPLVNR